MPSDISTSCGNLLHLRTYRIIFPLQEIPFYLGNQCFVRIISRIIIRFFNVVIVICEDSTENVSPVNGYCNINGFLKLWAFGLSDRSHLIFRRKDGGRQFTTWDWTNISEKMFNLRFHIGFNTWRFYLIMIYFQINRNCRTTGITKTIKVNTHRSFVYNFN